MRRGKNKMRREVVYVVETEILLFQSARRMTCKTGRKTEYQPLKMYCNETFKNFQPFVWQDQ